MPPRPGPSSQEAMYSSSWHQSESHEPVNGVSNRLYDNDSDYHREGLPSDHGHAAYNDERYYDQQGQYDAYRESLHCPHPTVHLHKRDHQRQTRTSTCTTSATLPPQSP